MADLVILIIVCWFKYDMLSLNQGFPLFVWNNVWTVNGGGESQEDFGYVLDIDDVPGLGFEFVVEVAHTY